jgi:hypothetical protein
MPDLQEPPRQGPPVALLSDTFQPLDDGAVYSLAHRFTSQPRELLSTTMGFFVLDI